MNRRKAREYVLQMLFQSEFSGPDRERAVPEGVGPGKDDKEELRHFAMDIYRGTLGHLEEIDGVIQDAAEHWGLHRMAAVDRNILRFAVYEILFRDDIPAAVTINEALEVAKKYSSLESVPFINGLLDKIARTRAKA
jgi:N utilization substance protein B